MTLRLKIALISSLVGFSCILIGVFLFLDVPTGAQEDNSRTPTGNNSFCVLCHNANAAQNLTFADGTTVSIAVDVEALHTSVHGAGSEEGALGCLDCHTEVKFPHEQVLVENARIYRINQREICADCHVEQATESADGVHYEGLVNGNLRAATCVDCHGAHDVQPPDEPRQEISETCGDCHQIVYNDYAMSVHGEALAEGDPNVPTCVDCHGVHGIEHPTTALFRNRSPELCADCHADEDLMEEYDITTNVFNSYLTDFHGTTVALFEQQDPNVPTNKAVCYDCHGVHNIQRVDESTSQVVKDNLLETCRQCHPGATTNFPASWVGHFEPTLDSHPLLFAVNTFYDFLIPGVLGVFVFLVGTDIFRRIRKAVKRGK